MNPDSLRHAKLMAFMAATSFIFCSGVMTGNRQMYWMASLLGVLIGGMYLVARWLAPRVNVSRQLPAEVREGEPFDVILEVSLPMWRVPVWYQIREQFSAGLEVQNTPRFLLPRQRVKIRYRVVPMRRGEHRVGPTELTVSDLLGLFEIRRLLPGSEDVLVLPRPVPLPNRTWEGGSRGRAHQVSSRSTSKGEGTDWHGTREYTPGDPLRRINWRATARHQSWHVQQFETSLLAPLLIAIELAPRWQRESDGFCPDFERAIRHIAWLATEAPRSGIRVYITGPGWEGVRIEGASFHEVRQALRALARLQPESHLSLAQQLHVLVQQYGEQFTLCLFVPPAERRHYESLIQPYLQRGYTLQVYA
ncbi:hypothetical protein HRbin15_01883 [bacterium HR15]|nr:hypothetical protein HRbin15_01883 [bacterium HR15]